ncbi:Patellin-3, partial [Cucurbita argyrosperma subsp. argyrosperma]
MTSNCNLHVYSHVNHKTPPKGREKKLSIWGVPLLEDHRTGVILLMFLRAREFKVRDAFPMFRNTIRWREEFGIDSLLCCTFRHISLEDDLDTAGRGVFRKLHAPRKNSSYLLEVGFSSYISSQAGSTPEKTIPLYSLIAPRLKRGYLPWCVTIKNRVYISFPLVLEEPASSPVSDTFKPVASSCRWQFRNSLLFVSGHWTLSVISLSSKRDSHWSSLSPSVPRETRGFQEQDVIVKERSPTGLWGRVLSGPRTNRYWKGSFHTSHSRIFALTKTPKPFARAPESYLRDALANVSIR